MPISKRSKVVPLTKTQKRPSQEKKTELIDKIHSYATQYQRAFVFRTKNARNLHLKSLRESFSQGAVQGKLVFGKHALIKVALKSCPDMNLDGVQDKLLELFGSNVSGCQVSLFFTDANSEEVRDALEHLQAADYVRAENLAPFDFTLKEGQLFYPLQSDLHCTSEQSNEQRFPLPASMAALLRMPQYGSIPTKLEKGCVMIMRDYDICKVGESVSVEMARVMKLLNIQHQDSQLGFRVELLACYDKMDNEVTSFEE